MRVKATAVALAIVSVALLLNVVPAPTIHFPGIVPLTMLACVVMIPALGIYRPRQL